MRTRTLAMRALADDGLSAFSPASTAGRSQHCLGGVLQEAPSSPSLASNMNPTSCRTLPDLAPGTCSIDVNEAICFPLLLTSNQPLPPCLGPQCVSVPKTPRETGLSPLSLNSALLCILRNHPFHKDRWSESSPEGSLPGPAKATAKEKAE